MPRRVRLPTFSKMAEGIIKLTGRNWNCAGLSSSRSHSRTGENPEDQKHEKAHAPYRYDRQSRDTVWILAEENAIRDRSKSFQTGDVRLVDRRGSLPHPLELITGTLWKWDPPYVRTHVDPSLWPIPIDERSPKVWRFLEQV